MQLSELVRLSGVDVSGLTGDCDILSLSADSRKKTRGGLFFCVAGARYDAHDFAGEAVANGAVALVVTRQLPDVDVPQLLVKDDRAAMALIAGAFYGKPAAGMKLMGVTGTKGKTTTSYFLKAILEKAGFLCGLIGTTGNMIGHRWTDSGLTTPDPIELHETFRRMADAGVQVVVMEVSAHALSMCRLEGLTFEAACYTNLSQDHLDFFFTMENYFAAKQSFFTSGMARNAAINSDDDHAAQLLEALSIPLSTYGICTNADIFARDIEISENGVAFTLSLWNEHQYPVRLKLMGMFNVYNALAAAASALILGVDPQAIGPALEGVKAVPGRAEVLDTHTPFKVILDYSHSPDALENILKTVRSIARRRVIVVFGCGGDRDQGKRPLMGQTAGRLADYSILTSDNPRSEDPMDILIAIESGIKATGGAYELQQDRREAITKALTMASEGDYVILAGKGHETYQEVNGVKRPFDEKLIVSELLLRPENGRTIP